MPELTSEAEGRAPTPPARPIWRFVPVTLLTPMLGAALGIDGGAIFQIIAVENLGLGAAAIGIAFGFGVVSLPVQILAARFPLHRARRNVQWFLLIAALQSWLLAVLVTLEATGGIAMVALGVTVAAEVALSVLFATAWQPLLSSNLASVERQRLNSMGPAVARGVLAGSLVVFAALGEDGRAIFLGALGLLSIAAAAALNTVQVQQTPLDANEAASAKHDKVPLRAATRLTFLVLSIVNLGALPLWLVYLNKVLWPEVNLGVIAALQTVASVAALAAWRPTEGELLGRATTAAALTLGAAVLLALLQAPVEDTVARATTIVGTVVMAGGATTIRIALLESIHRIVDARNTVRVFTLLDVVASTSLQVGLLLAGLVITFSHKRTDWPIDPYQLLLLTSAGLALLALRRLRSSAT